MQLAQFYTYLLFQDRLKISDAAWASLLAQGWFPFLPLGTALVKDMVNYGDAGWNVDELLPRISGEVRASVGRWMQKWRKQDFFSPHTEVLSKAVERFEANDYVSAVSILYPRIEGVMRSYHAAIRPSASQSQKELVDSNTTSRAGYESLLLLPERFRRYLTEVYFAAFDPKNPAGVSRHTIAHGVAPEDAFSEKAAVVGLLLAEQLSYYYAE